MIISIFVSQKPVNAPVTSTHHGTAINHSSTAVQLKSTLPVQAASKASLPNLSLMLRTQYAKFVMGQVIIHLGVFIYILEGEKMDG